ncbi:DNA cytosine methyltransferase, partial [Klebsiella pneumoniae]
MVKTLRNDLVKRFKISQSEAEKRVIKFDIQKVDELINGSWSDEILKDYGDDNNENIIKHGLNGLIKDKKIDVIIGGPPCQAYSIAGRAQDKHSMKYDYRNYLFESFVKIVDYYKPR